MKFSQCRIINCGDSNHPISPNIACFNNVLFVNLLNKRQIQITKA
jgi:hypothetical protein